MKFPNLDMYHLMIFFYVAKERSITLAAEKLCLTQPTVTNHIKSLERDTHTKLIEINRKRVALTVTGQGLYRYAEEIYRQAIAAERFVELMRESSINIGVSPLFVPAIAGAINTMSERLSSAIKLNVQFGDAFDLVKDVIDSKIDLAVVPNLDYGSDRLSHVRISDGIKLVFYASPIHPIFKKEQIEWQDLCSYPLVVGQETSSTQKIVSNKLAAEGVRMPLKLDLSVNNVECCKILAQNGKSICVALMEDIRKEVDDGKLRPLSLPGDIWVEVDAVIRRVALTSPLIQHFITCAKASF